MLSNQIDYYQTTPITAAFMEKISSKNLEVFEKFLLLADKFKPNPPKLMVDFGCSCGTLMSMFREHSWDVLGIEI